MKPLITIIKMVVLVSGLSVFSLLSTPMVSSLQGTVAHAAVASNIVVRGNQRMEADTVISYLTISPGERYSQYDIDQSVKALYATGLFGDVSIYSEGRTLVVEVSENATVNKVFFEGNTRLKDEALSANVQVRERSIYSDEKAAADVDLIKLAYGRVGREDADVSYEVVPLTNNRVNVIYRINEGDKTKISQINFVGNQTFSDRRLADLISTKESNLFSFLTTNDIYDPNRINADQELLRRFYFNNGFADFDILSVDADLDPVDNEYVITFTMEEGVRYTFGQVNVESSIPGVAADGLYPLLETASGDYYSAKEVEDSIIAITDRVASEGFAFAEVVPRGNRNFDNNTIDVTYLVDEGARVYIEEIQIYGNNRTRDYVIRREFDLSEGDAYNRVLLQKTRRRLEKLGFFDGVELTTKPGSEPDKVIVIVRLTEKSTGEFSLSGGYSSNGGASGEISFSERNFLGRGQYVRVRARTGDDEQLYGFDFVEPYFLGYRMSAGISLTTSTSQESDNRDYSIDTNTGTISFGIPITEKLSSKVFYTIRDTETNASQFLLDPNTIVGPATKDGIQGNIATELSNAFVIDLGPWLSSGVGYSLTYVDLDNETDPREGIYAELSQTFYGVGGDANFLQTDGKLVAYSLISEDYDTVLFGRVRAGHLESFNATGIRSFDNYQASSRSIRGFDSFGYGPRDPITNDALGGQTHWNATAEVQFPLPFVPRSLGLRGAVFADAGQLFNLSTRSKNAVIASNPGLTAAQLNQLDGGGVRASVGGSVIWASPFGPLRVDYAVPIAEEAFDDIEEFSFGVSSKF